MDRSQFYFLQLLTRGENNQAFDDIERMEQDKIIDLDTWGVLTGLDLSETGPATLKLDLTAGVAADELGRRIVLDAAVLVDLAAYVPAVGGEQVILHIYGKNYDVESDPRVDGAAIPLNYRLTESIQVLIVAGATVAAPASAPAIVADQVLLGEVVIDNGDVTILNAAITAQWWTTPETRQEGGIAIKHGRLNTEYVRFNSAAGVQMLDLGFLQMTAAGGGIDTQGADITLEDGAVKKAAYVGADEPDPGNLEGHLYTDVSSGALLEIKKAIDIPAAIFMPALQTIDPWSATPATDDAWRLQSLNNINWEMFWDGISAGAPRTGIYLMAPIQAPEGSKLVRCTIRATVLAALVANLDFKCGVAYSAKDPAGPGITTHITKTYNVATGGVWAAGGAATVIAMDTGDAALTIANGDGYTTYGNSYWVFMYLDDSVGVGANNFMQIFGATANILIREASGVYTKP